VTLDHTLVEEMVLQGLITPSEAKNHPKRNYITRALGTGGSVEIDLIQLEIRPDDVYLLCSDGLSGYLEDRQMLSITLSEDGWQQKLKRLVQIALDNGGSDNITAMYVTFKEEDR